ncbi:MAG: SGNH/GDSL hydrolase family protein [Clostridia bacterium]|nr:SGNH/GDSL hydrolase family protein [Clostridia bacterium]
MGNLFIFGDSYSTFSGYIPENNKCYYPKTLNDGRILVANVEDTWWHQFVSKTNSNLLCNDSWDGSTVSKSGYNGIATDDSPFIIRAEKYLKNGMYNQQKVDTIIVFGGTNDNWANAPIGDYKFSDWNEKDFEAFLPSYCYLISYLKKEMPDTRIITIINTELKDEVSDGIKEISKHYNVEFIELKNIKKICGHPDEEGMRQIANQIIENL